MNEPRAEVRSGGATDVRAVRRRFATRPRTWDVMLAISVGGALGAVARYALGTVWSHPPVGFPWVTFAINVSGCFMIGALMVVLTEVAGRPHRLARPFLGVGVLGGFTTFSTYAVEAQRLIASGDLVLALAYLFGTMVAALVATMVGIVATRYLTRSGTPEGR